MIAKKIGILWLILGFGMALLSSEMQAQSFFTFTYTGPDSLYVDASCEAILDWGHPETPEVDYDAPPGGVLISFDIRSISGGYEIGDTLTAGETVTVTYEALDNQGNFEFFSFELPVVDTLSPEVDWSFLADTVTVFCFEDLALDPLEAIDNCTAEENLIWEAPLSDSLSPCTGGQTTRTFMVSDEFGNTNSYEQTVIMVLDTLAPQIITGPTDTILNCKSAELGVYNWLQEQVNRLEATDMPCDSINYSVDSTFLSGLDTVCGERIVSFYATDACGNQQEMTASLTILDSIAPILLEPARDTVIQCAGQDGLSVFQSWLAVRGGMEVEENCEIFESHVPADVDFEDFCNQAVEVTFFSSDRCGTEVSSSASFELLDTLAPEFIDLPSNLISTCANENYLNRAENWIVDLGGGSVQDLCAPDSLIQITYRVNGQEWGLDDVLDSLESQGIQGCRDSVAVGGNRLDNVLIALQLEFVFRDPCGNTLFSEPRWIALIDANAPVISEEARDTTILCSDSAQVRSALLAWYDDRAGLRVMDDCGEVLRRPSIDRDDLWAVYLQQNNTNCGYTGELALEFGVEDLCGRTGPMQEATFFVIDTLPPDLTEPPVDYSLDCSTSARDSLVGWIDAGGHAQFDASCGGVRLDSFFWSDSEGRSGVGLSGTGPYPDVSQLGCQYEIEVDFQLKDDCENVLLYSSTFYLTDTKAPQFNNYPDSSQLNCGEEAEIFEDLITDDCFPDLFSLQVLDDTLRSGVPGDCSYHTFSISRTLIATDDCGNSRAFEQYITYGDDTPPVFTPPTDTIITCEDWNTGILLPEPTGILDDCGGSVELNFRDSVIDQACGFLVLRNWILEDGCGNQSAHLQQIEVLDEQPPVFDRISESNLVFCQSSSSDAETLFLAFLDTLSPDFSDGCSSVDSFIALKGSYDLNSPSTWPGTLPTDFSWSCGAYASDTLYHVDLSYVIYDGCNQARDTTISFTILDTVSPQILCERDTVLYVAAGSCERDFRVPLPELDWGCTSEEGRLWVRIDSMAAMETLSPDTLLFTLPAGIHSVEYLARSCNNNEDGCTFTVNVLDTIKPEITCPADTSIFLPSDSCTLGVDLLVPTSIMDNCALSDSVSLNYTDGVGTFNSNWTFGDSISPRESLVGGVNRINFELLDVSGNGATCTYSFELIDTTAPTANCRPALVRVNPSGLIKTAIDPALFDVNSFDVCGIDSMATQPDTVDCSWVGADTAITFYVFDAYGNIDSCETIMRVETEILQPGFELNICNPDTLRLLANPPPPANIFTYNWTGPNNFSSNQQNPVLLGVGPQNSGTYELQIEGLAGCEAFGTVTVNIGDDIEPDLNVNFPTQCEGQSIRLLSNPYAGNVTYQWYEGLPPNGVLIGTSQQAFFQVTPTVGAHDYYVVVETSECTSLPSAPVGVEIILQPQAEVLEELIIACEGEDVLLRGVNNGPGFTYSWVGPNGYFSDLAMPPALEGVDANNAGIYQFIAEIGDCVSTPVEVELIVRERPDAAQFEPEDVVCEGESFELTLQSPLNADQYRWFSPDQSMTTTQAPNLSISQAQLSMTGLWQVEVERNGCTSDSLGQIEIEVEALPILDIRQGGSLCQGDSLILSVQELPGASYSWSTPDGSYSGAEIQTPARSGSFLVSYISSNGCQTTAQIELEQVRPPDITAISNTGTDCVGSGQNIELRASVFPMDTGSYSYEWTGPNGFVDTRPVGVISNVTASDNGWYTLRVLESGCWSNLDSTFLDITIIPEAPEIEGPTSYCVGDTLDLRVKDSLGPEISYIWLTPKGDTLTQELDLNLNLNDRFYTGYYQVRASIEGCRGAFSDSVFIQVTPLPEIPTIRGSLEVCEGEALLVQPGSIDPTLDYRWEFSNGEVTTQTVVLIGNAGTEWTGTVRVEAFRNGCSSGLSPPVELLVKALPDVPVIDPVANGVCLLDDKYSVEICISDSAAMGGVNYQWYDATDFSSLSGLSGNLCFTINQDQDWQPGQNSFTVRAERADCFSDFSVPVNIQASQPSDFDPMAGVGDTICGEESFFTQALPPMQGSGQWFVGAGNAQFESRLQAQTEAFDFDFGSNILVWSLSDGFCTDYTRDSITIWYDDFPRAQADSFSTAYNERQRLDILTNDDYRDIRPIEISQNPRFGEVQNQVEELLYFPQNGFIGIDTFIYRICSDICPQLCEDAEVVVQVGDETLCDIPSIFTPNNDGINDFFVIQCLSSGDYPNNKLVIFNQNGSEVFYSEAYNNDWQGQYQGEDLPVGTYFYILDFGDGQPPERGFLVLER